MGKRISQKKKKKYIKIVEFFVLILIGVVFLLIADKYILNGFKRTDFFIRINSEVIDYFNNKKFKKAVKKNVESRKNNNSVVVRKLDLTLIYNSGDWLLKGTDDYIVSTDKDKLVIKTKQGDYKNYEIDIIGVDTYYPIRNITRLNITADSNSEIFRVYEQEDFIPIFGYHNVLPDDGKVSSESLDIQLKDFKEQVVYTTNVMGCRWYTFSDIVENFILKDKKTPKKACIMTFDDGQANNYYNAYPVLQKLGIKASFYVVPGRFKPFKYMVWEQVDELYRNGYDIESHSVNSGGLISEKWNYEELIYQIEESKKILQERGYEVKTFAYPLGEWNDEIVDLIKSSGYIASRDISKNNHWRDKRALTTSMDSDFIWHMNYYKSEQKNIQEIERDMSYNTWWQFEEGYSVVSDENDNIKIRSSIDPTTTSYAIVVLSESGDKITNKFIISRDGNYTIDIYGATKYTKDNHYFGLDNINVYVDGVLQKKVEEDKTNCSNLDDWLWCDYFISTFLDEGSHTITIEAVDDDVRVDKFRIFRKLKTQNSYNVIITEFENDLDKTTPLIFPKVIFNDNFSESEIIEESGEMNKSLNFSWWVNSGAFLIKENGVGKTLHGKIEENSKWQNAYLKHNAIDTDNGFRPQNIFRLITRNQWGNSRQTIYIKIKKYSLSKSDNRSESNGVLIFSKYKDSDNLYYVGVRVDGQAVIKKKIKGKYYTIGVSPIFKGKYNRKTNPNLLPENIWIGLRSEVKTINNDEVSLKLFFDKENNGNWELILEAIDDGKSYGGNAILGEGHSGIRTDFMDVEFDDYSIIKI